MNPLPNLLFDLTLHALTDATKLKTVSSVLMTLKLLRLLVFSYPAFVILLSVKLEFTHSSSTEQTEDAVRVDPEGLSGCRIRAPLFPHSPAVLRYSQPSSYILFTPENEFLKLWGSVTYKALFSRHLLLQFVWTTCMRDGHNDDCCIVL